MAFKKNWDTPDIITQLRSLARECSSVYNDGFTSFEIKKELYLIKEVVDKAIHDSPEFGKLEKEWLDDREKKKLISILKKG
jgi:diphthamide biosynthesis methyltransferase